MTTDDSGAAPKTLDAVLVHALRDGGEDLVRAAHLLCDVHLGLPELTEDAWKQVNTEGGLIYDVLVGAMKHLVEDDREQESFILAQRWKTPLVARPVIDTLQRTVSGREELELMSFFATMDSLKTGVSALAACTTPEAGLAPIERIIDAAASLRAALDRRSLADPVQAWRLGRISYPDELIDALQERAGPVCLVDLTCASEHMFVHILGRDGNRVEVTPGLSPFPLSQVLECVDVYENYVVRQIDPEQTSRALDFVCNTLHKYLWCKLAETVGALGFSQIILIPDAWTRGLPHHLSTLCGAEVKVPPDVPVVRRERLVDLFPLEVAPSVQSVAITHWQLRPRNVAKLVMACDPNDDLPGAAWSARFIRDRLSDDLGFVPLVGRDATKAAALREMRDARLIVFSGHGDYLPDDVPASHLRFSDSNLTLREIIEGEGVVPGAVYILSCCELGTGTPGEKIQGFAVPGALLAGGAACVVSALWEMEDVSFGYLTDRFLHRLAHPGWRPAAALFRAMNDVKTWARDDVIAHIGALLAWMEAEGRDERQPQDYLRMSQLLARIEDEGDQLPFADPKYWGGAVVFGCGWSGLAGAAPIGIGDEKREMEVILTRKPHKVRELIAKGQLETAAREIDEWLAWAHGSEKIIPFELQAEVMERAGVDRRAVVNQYRRLELMSKAHEDHEMAQYAARKIEYLARL